MSVDAILSASSALRFAGPWDSRPLTGDRSFGLDDGELELVPDSSRSDRLNLLQTPSFQALLKEFIQRLKLENERLLTLADDPPDAEDYRNSDDIEERADRLREDLLTQSQVENLRELNLAMNGGLNLLA